MITHDRGGDAAVYLAVIYPHRDWRNAAKLPHHLDATSDSAGFANPIPLWRDEPALEVAPRRDDKSRVHRAQNRVFRMYHPRFHGERIARLSGCCCVARGCCCCCGLWWRSSGGARRVHVAGHAHERGRSVLTAMRTHAATARLKYPPCRRTREHCSLYPDFICHFMVALIIYFFSTQRCQLLG